MSPIHPDADHPQPQTLPPNSPARKIRADPPAAPGFEDAYDPDGNKGPTLDKQKH